MELPKALRCFLHELNGHAAPSLHHGKSSLYGLAAHDEGELRAISVTCDHQWKNETSLILLWRSLLSLLPSSVLERPDEPCRELVKRRLCHLLGETPPLDDLEEVMRVVKRLQQYRKGGRGHIGNSSLDLDKTVHAQLLRSQSGRCGACGYKFSDADLFSDLDVTEEEWSGEIQVDESEAPALADPSGPRNPARLLRHAVLDHIYPIYLGGNAPSNWQILCATCNSGKADLVLGIEGRGWFGSARLLDLTTVTSQLFYMVMKRDGKCSSCGRGPKQVELRLLRRDSNGADLYPNLHCVCTDCFSSRN
jgi:hypothetical protein